MNLYYIFVAALVILVGWAVYHYANQPQPLSERAESAMQEVEQGNPGQAMNELAPQTRAENMLNETKEAIGVTPTSTY